MIRRVEWIIIFAILLAYLVLAGQYATRTPDWQAPDEPAHYNYVRQIADEGQLPVLKWGDWQQEYQDELTASGFRPDLLDDLDTVQYEDHQPPLYYLLQAPVYALSDGDLVTMRLFSALLGAGVILLTWFTLGALMPRWPGLACTGAAFVAFIPQHLSILASVSNDALAELVTAAVLLTVTVYLGAWRVGTNGPVRRVPPWVMGVLVGVALLTKTTIYFLGGIAVMAVLLRARRDEWKRPQIAAHLAAVLIPALLIGGVWWVRNLVVYGDADFMGLQRHNEITLGQKRTDDYINVDLGGSERQYLQNFVQTTFHSFWGQFGWMAIPMPTNVYRLLLVFSLGVISGFGVFLWRRNWQQQLNHNQGDVFVVFVAVIALVTAAHVLYNMDFVQFQGRYLYPMLIPLALIVAVGLYGWTALVEGYAPALAWLPVTAMIGFAVFAWYALDTYIVPNLPAW